MKPTAVTLVAAAVVAGLVLWAFTRNPTQPGESVDRPPAAAAAQTTKPEAQGAGAPVAPRRTESEPDLLALLDLGVPPTPENVKRMIAALFEDADVEARVKALLALLRETSLAQERQNAAVLGVRSGLQLLYSNEHRERHGIEPAFRTASAVLDAIPAVPEVVSEALTRGLTADVPEIAAPHVDGLRTLLLQDPVPQSAIDLFVAWMDVRGARDAFLQLAVEMVSHPDERVRAAALRYLMRFDPEVTTQALAAAFRETKTAEARSEFLRAIVCGLNERDPQAGLRMFVSLLQEMLQKAGDGSGIATSKDDPDLVVAPIAFDLMQAWSPDLLHNELRAGGIPPEIGRVLLAYATRDHLELVERVLSDPGLEPLHSRAVATLSGFESSDRVAELTRPLLREARGRALDDALVAAWNLASHLSKHREPWGAALAEDLRRVVLDANRDLSQRRRALRALLTMKDEAALQPLAGADLPAPLRAMLEQR